MRSAFKRALTGVVDSLAAHGVLQQIGSRRLGEEGRLGFIFIVVIIVADLDRRFRNFVVLLEEVAPILGSIKFEDLLQRELCHL